jgi:transposase
MLKTVEKSGVSPHNLEVKIAALEIENRHLKEQLEWLKRQVFGQKSERFVDPASEDELLPGLNLTDPLPDNINEIIVPVHKRRKKKGGKNKFKVDIPEDLPRKKEYKDIPESSKFDSKTGEKLVKIGEEVVEKLAFQPGNYYVKQIIYPKYASKNNSLFGVAQASSPDCIIEGSKFDPSFMAHVVTEKFAYHMPLNRINEKLKCHNIKISDQTLCGLVINLGHKVEILCEVMKEKLFEQGVIFTDDTPINLIVNGMGKTKEARVWGYFGGKPNAPPYHLYEFSSDRCEIHSMTYLKDFEGIIHGDAYSAYEKINDSEDYRINWAACWSHARRKFEHAVGIDIEFRNQILRLIRYLFLFERIARVSSAEQRLNIRTESEKQIVDKIFNMLKNKVKDNTLPPGTNLATAVGYMLCREDTFRFYLTHPDARMDNNIAENGMRKLVIGRKNWLFVGSKRSGKAMANLLSLVQTCRAMKIDPQKYLEDIFKRLPGHPHKNLQELLPDRWAAAQQ